MALLKKMHSVIGRILRKEDIVLVPQAQGVWDIQYSNGAWDRLLSGEENMRVIASRIGALQQHGPLRVLDVGCGNGALGMLLAAFPGITYVGIDFSESALKQARHQVPSGTFIRAGADAPPSTLGVFDVLVFSEVLYYVDPRTVLPLYKVHVAPNAQLFISVMRFLRSWFIWNRIRKVITVAEMLTVQSTGKRRVAWNVAIGGYPQSSRDVL